MAVTYGFYDSLNHDRLYNAKQMSAIFDGIINDGVFMSVGNQFHTVAGTGMQVIVKSGRAWFDSTWTLNDAEYPLSIDAADVLLTRIDAVVLEVNSEVATRANTIKVVKGTPASTPAKPTLTNTAAVHQHALAYVTVAKNTTAITNSMIEIVVGKTETPYVTAILQTTDITDLFKKWESDFQVWFETVKGTLDGDVALNLQNQIDHCVKKADKATSADIEAGTADKWVSSESALKIKYKIGDIYTSIRKNDIYPICNGDMIDFDSPLSKSELFTYNLRFSIYDAMNIIPETIRQSITIPSGAYDVKTLSYNDGNNIYITKVFRVSGDNDGMYAFKLSTYKYTITDKTLTLIDSNHLIQNSSTSTFSITHFGDIIIFRNGSSVNYNIFYNIINGTMCDYTLSYNTNSYLYDPNRSFNYNDKTLIVFLNVYQQYRIILVWINWTTKTIRASSDLYMGADSYFSEAVFDLVGQSSLIYYIYSIRNNYDYIYYGTVTGFNISSGSIDSTLTLTNNTYNTSDLDARFMNIAPCYLHYNNKVYFSSSSLVAEVNTSTGAFITSVGPNAQSAKGILNPPIAIIDYDNYKIAIGVRCVSDYGAPTQIYILPDNYFDSNIPPKNANEVTLINTETTLDNDISSSCVVNLNDKIKKDTKYSYINLINYVSTYALPVLSEYDRIVTF